MFFKSVFSRYIVTFMVIIIVSFLVLALLISSFLRDYSKNITQNDLVRIANSSTEMIGSQYDLSANEYEGFTAYIEGEYEAVSRGISAIAHYSTDRGILVLSLDGAVLMSDDGLPADFVLAAFPEKSVKAVEEKGSLLESSDFSGAFKSAYLTYFKVVEYADAPVGIVAAVSTTDSVDALVTSTIKMLLMACMWVMCGAIIASYFISERTVAPLREMSKAAKEFGAGHMDVRVPVHGSDEIAELAMAFNNMASSVATLEDTRRTFLANVSHDLRTPMTTISGFIDGILDGAIPPEKYDYYLSIIATEVRRLSRLVSSLLDISRIQAGERKFNMQPFDICEMARQILISFEQRIDDKRLDVSFETDEDRMIAVADRDAIYQILYNICDNAVKFSREGGKYRLSITERDKKLRVSVYNEGQGIEAEDLPHIFDRFYKSDKSRGLDKSGVGLGMYIAKTIIDAHGETIGVSSKAGEWCEFTFTLKKDTGKHDIEINSK